VSPPLLKVGRIEGTSDDSSDAIPDFQFVGFHGYVRKLPSFLALRDYYDINSARGSDWPLKISHLF